MSKPLKYSIFLLVLGLIAGGLLALVNSITAPYIEKRKEQEANEVMQQFFPELDFRSIADQFANLDSGIIDIYIGENDTSKYVAYRVSANGYRGSVVSLVVIDITDGTFKLVKTIDASTETAGFGQEALKHDFTTIYSNIDSYQYADARRNISEIMSGSTLTYTAIIQSVDIAVIHFVNNQEMIEKG